MQNQTRSGRERHTAARRTRKANVDARLVDEIIRSLQPRLVLELGSDRLGRLLRERGVQASTPATLGDAAPDLAIWLDVPPWDERPDEASLEAAKHCPRLLFQPRALPDGETPLLGWLQRLETAGLHPRLGYDARFAGPFAVLLEPPAGLTEHRALDAIQLIRMRTAVETLGEENERLRDELGAARAQSRREQADAKSEVMRARLSAHDANVANHEARLRLAQIESSFFWRATGPVRRVLVSAPWLRRLLLGSVKLAWWTVTLQAPRRLRARREFFAAQRAAAMAAPAAPAAPMAAETAVRTLDPPAARTEVVDVVVCVHNAFEDVRRCLSSLIANTLPPYRIIIVDDGSTEPTRDYLAAFAAAQGATLIRNQQARGYTFAANQGMRASDAPWVVLLNSDTIVTFGWLDRMVDLAARDSRTGVVGPLSNTASWQSVPEMLVGGDWAENPLPPDIDIARMGRLVAGASARQGMPLPFMNGFCLLLRRAMLNDVGLFDEETFGAGYGEENDLCIRARDAGWSLVVADDAYVFHAQSKSYSHERRLQRAARADAALREKHDFATKVDRQVAFCRFNTAMAGVRARARAAMERDRLIRDGRERWQGLRVAFILPVTEEGGGANVIVQEIRALERMGVDTWILNQAGFQEGYERAYPDLRHKTLYGRGEAEIDRIAADPLYDFDAVIATYNLSVFWIGERVEGRLAYYIQDYEPLFFTPGEDHHKAALRSYTARPEMTLMTKSVWNADAVEGGGAARPAVLGPSVDIDLFRPLPRSYAVEGAPVRVCAMVRPATPRRGPRRTVDTLNALKRQFGPAVEIVVFGCDNDELSANDLALTGAANLGRLGREQVAWLLERSDVFLDFSEYQAMGLTALEAMASGCAVVVPRQGGAVDFARHEENALVVDTLDAAACQAAAARLVADAGLREAIRLQAAEDACRHHPEGAAFRMMEAIFGAEG